MVYEKVTFRVLDGKYYLLTLYLFESSNGSDNCESSDSSEIGERCDSSHRSDKKSYQKSFVFPKQIVTKQKNYKKNSPATIFCQNLRRKKNLTKILF